MFRYRDPGHSASPIAACLVAALLATAIPARAHLAQLDEQQMIHSSAHIVVATVESAETRWNDRRNLIVTDYVLAVEDRLLGNAPARLRITMAGGTLDGETHQTCLSTPIETGARYLLFLDDLKVPTFNPVVGGWQGVFREVAGEDGHRYIAAGANPVLLRAAGNRVEFSTFVQNLRARIAEALASPPPSLLRRSTPEEREGLPVKEYDPSSAREGRPETAEPRTDDRARPPLPLFPIVESAEAVLREGPREPEPFFQEYVYQRAPSRPIVVNQLPRHFWVSPHDEYMMSTWNTYASNLFRVYATPTNTWAWRNGVYDLAGFPSNSQMIQQFGQGWGSTTLGVTYSRWTSGPIIEADVALNPAYSWTLDERTATRPGNPHSFRQTMLHELGHVWGLKHPWETQNVWWDSIMNYPPQTNRLAKLQADDTTAVRRAYPGTSIHDVILSGYRTRDNSSSNHASYFAALPSPSTVRAGSSFSLTDSIKIENGGTDNIVNPGVEIYLVPQRMSWTGAIYLKTAQYTTTVQPFATVYLNLGSMRVPSNVAAGTYFIGYFVRDNRDGTQNNNSAWSDWNGTVRVTR